MTGNESNSKTTIVLGTVQFGMKYGINHTGKPSTEEVFRIFDLAQSLGIRELDTAEAYGNASDIIGRYNLARLNRFNIVTKVVLNGLSFYDLLVKNIKRLNVETIAGCYLHQFSELENQGLSSDVERAKKNGMLKKFGVSIYTEEELEIAAQHPLIDIIQLPFNIFDQSERKKKLIALAKSQGKMTYIRSVFLQGLFFMDPNRLPEKLLSLKNSLIELQKMATMFPGGMTALALDFVRRQNGIDKIIIGVESSAQLQEIMKAINFNNESEIKNLNLEKYGEISPELVNPKLWSTT